MLNALSWTIGLLEHYCDLHLSGSSRQSADHTSPIRGTLTFGRVHIYELEYCLSPVQRSYNFILSEVTCLRQVRMLGRDELLAEVEYNASPEARSAGPKNVYHLGGFKSHNSCSGVCV